MNGPKWSGDNALLTLIWLVIGLAPIPILLVVVSSNQSSPPSPALGVALLIICPLCNLAGGIGCLRGIENVGLRIVLGLLLAAFFFCLSLIVAIFQACSHMNF